MPKKPIQKWIKFSLDDRLYDKISQRKHKQLADNVREDLESYYSLLEYGFAQARKALSPKEALLVLDVMNGHLYTPGHAYMYAESALLASVEDGCVLEALDMKWGVKKDVLLQKLSDLPGYARLALVDWALMSWEKKIEDNFNIEKLKNIFKGE